MTHYHSVSGGAGSWLAAKLNIDRHPNEEHRFLFADTLYEDADCYRFLIEGIAYLIGRDVSNVLPRAHDFPDYRVSGDFDIETYAGNPKWRSFLQQLRADVSQAMPELIWLVEGRDPWEVFRDRKFLGNSRIDPCSIKLKREVLAAWRDANASPDEDVFIVGIGTGESHRYDRLAGRMAKDGWLYEAPLIGTIEGEIPFVYLTKASIERPRLYRKGYIHNNCGGYCIKGGHAHYQNRFKVDRDRFEYDALMEEKLAAYLGKPVTMMTDRSGDNIKKPMSLNEFADRILSDPQTSIFPYEPGTSGCGCF